MKIRQLLYSIPLLVFASCDQLGSVSDIEPEYVLTENTVFVDANSVEALANGMYLPLRGDGVTQMRNCMLLLTRTSNNSSVASAYEFKINDVSPRSSLVSNYYSNLYLIVNQANIIIEGLPNASPKALSEERKTEILGEAYFNRAFANFMLLRSFGEFWDENSEYGIVLYDSPVKSNNGKARSSVKTCYELINSDLDKAIVQAPGEGFVNYKANRLAAKVLKARVKLCQGDFAAAESFADEAITESVQTGNTLEGNYGDIYEKAYESSELLFSAYTSYPQETISTGVFFDFYYNGFGYTLQTIADELVGESEDGDYGSGEGMDPRYASVYITDEWEGGSETLIKKYMNMINGNDCNPYYFIRLAEAYLIKAEAEARQSKYNEARNSLKIITDRAGYDTDYVNTITDSNLLMQIFRHKYMEISAENYEEWFDMIRYNQLDGTDFVQLGYLRSFAHKNLPIPYDAMAGNGALVQNPSYVYAYEEN